MPPSKLLTQISFLDSDLNWLESPLMPLLDRDFHTVLAQPLNGVDKLLESAMAA